MVIPMEGYKKGPVVRPNGTLWIPPSPNIRFGYPLAYATTGLLQAQCFLWDRYRTVQPVRAPWIKGEVGGKINSLNIPGFCVW